MRAVYYLLLSGSVLLTGCAVADADNGSRSDWVSCETKSDCGEGEACVAKRCEAVEAVTEPEPEGGEEPEATSPRPEDAGSDSAGSDDPDSSSVVAAEDDDTEARPDESMPQQDDGMALSGAAPQGDDESTSQEEDGMGTSSPSPQGDAGQLGDASVPGAQVETADAAPDAGADMGCSEASPCYSPAQCIADSASAGTDYCDNTASCSQNVEIDGEVEQRSGLVSLSCYSANGNLYQCTCSGGATNVMLNTMSPDAWNACSMALPNCAARLRL